MEIHPCTYRHALPEAGRFFCRHTSVAAQNHLVDETVCLACTARHRPCPKPRIPPPTTFPPLRSTAWWRFITTEQLIADTRRLLTKLPSPLRGVVGVPRSGMLPATFLAATLHVPLFEVSPQNGFRAVGHGLRLTSRAVDGPLLIVDDSVNTGQAFQQVRQIMSNLAPNTPTVYAAIYPTPSASGLVDLFVETIASPRLFEWNLGNCDLTRRFAFDLDGVICEDWIGDENNTREYLHFLEHAKPLYPPRRSSVRLIVTARMEKHRLATMQWLQKHGIHVNQLIMGPWASVAERRRLDNVSQFKGQAFAQSDCDLFLESNERQAREIFETSGKPVLCVTTGKVFQ